MSTHPFDNPYDEEEPVGRDFWRSQTGTPAGTTTYRMLDTAFRDARQWEADLRPLRDRQWLQWVTLDG